MLRDYRNSPFLNLEGCKKLVNDDKRDIDEADIILVNVTRISVGTSMEIMYAYDRRKMIIVVNSSGQELSPWIRHHMTVEADTLDGACNYILNFGN